MLKILILFVVLFIPLTLALYWLLTWMSKKDGEDDPWYLRFIGACFFSIIVTIVIMLFVFAFFGSVTIAKSLLGFEMDGSTLFYMILVVVAYAFILDDVLALIAKYLFRTSMFSLAAMAIIRFILFYIIGIFFDLSQQTNTMLAVILLCLFLVMDIYDLRDKKRKGGGKG